LIFAPPPPPVYFALVSHTTFLVIESKFPHDARKTRKITVTYAFPATTHLLHTIMTWACASHRQKKKDWMKYIYFFFKFFLEIENCLSRKEQILFFVWLIEIRHFLGGFCRRENTADDGERAVLFIFLLFDV
jgi:hypothetical protein